MAFCLALKEFFWYTKNMEKIIGLNQERVFEFKQKFGDNLIASKQGHHWTELLISQFKSPLIYILIFVAIISLLLGQFIDAALSVIVLIVNVIMGFYQEYNAEKTLAALKKLVNPKALVIRDGQRAEIEVKNIVPLDIIVLGAGDRIPADGHLVQGTKLLVNEAILTGEEEALPKSLDEELFMGTTVLSGKGLLQVVKIGQETRIGQISQSLLEIKDEKTPLQIRLESFIKYLAWVVLLICLVIFIFGIFNHQNIWEMLRIAIVLAIAAIPEGLPIAITVILALGVRRILKRKGLVKKLLSIETLGSTSVICTDKTGTLTEGVMKVVKVEFKDEEKALMALSLVNDERTSLEIALWNYVKNSKKIDPQAISDKYEKIDEEPFDSEKKYSLAVMRIENKDISFLLGAPEIVLSFCKIEENSKASVLQNCEKWAEEGLRILAIAEKSEGNLIEKENFRWLGLVGIQDPVRKEAKEAIRIAETAGIKIKIITGDYRRTAEVLARNLNFKIDQKNVMEGKELEEISEEDLSNRINDIVLFTRVSPHQKLKIVKILQNKGEVVAMTGDGVNDAPALKKADIGLVVGNGTDVAKEAGDLILLDNNFQTIVAAVEEGRLIFANIKKVVGYVLSNSFAEIILIFGAMILGFPTPLTVVQILWIHLICDGPPDIILGFEPKDPNLMKDNPKKIRQEKILSLPMKFIIGAISSTVGLLSLIFFRYYMVNSGDIELARTISFATVGSVSLIYILSFKNLKKPLWATGNFWSNKFLFVGIFYGFALLFLAIYLPFFNRILKVTPLQFYHWLLILSVGIITIIIVELVKFFQRKFER